MVTNTYAQKDDVWLSSGTYSITTKVMFRTEFNIEVLWSPFKQARPISTGNGRYLCCVQRNGEIVSVGVFRYKLFGGSWHRKGQKQAVEVTHWADNVGALAPT